jgi:predicted metal-dependent hydrolase
MALQSILPFDIPQDPNWHPSPSCGDADLLGGYIAPSVDRSVPAAQITYVRHPRAKRYVIRIVGDGQVRVTIPRWGSKREAARFVDAQRTWIDDRLVAERTARKRRAKEPRRPVRSAEEELAMRSAAARELPERLHELAVRFALNVTRVSVRNQRWRWGSCSPNGHICLNWRLAEMPAFVRDYVIIHELMHLKRMDHSQAFWKLVSAACPDYQAARRWLREHERNMMID